MAMKRCPTCGEKYSDTYKQCPFCEEEAALRSGAGGKRKGGHRAVQKSPGILSPILIIAILILAGVLAYLLFGDTIASKLGMEKAPVTPAASISEPAVSGSASGESSASSGTTSADTANLPETLKLSSSDFTMNVGDAPVKLSVSGGSGTYTWSSENEAVATVDANGSVTAIAAGTVNITASDGSGKGVCIVRVKGSGTPNTGNASGPVAMSTTDFTIKVGETHTIKITGTTSTVTWTSDNPAVATVSGGKVTGVASGKANITASVDGKTLVCIARVK